MGVYIDKFEPKNGLYQIDQGKIHKFKGKGGTVRVYPIQEIDLVRCGECKHCEKRETAKHILINYCEAHGISILDTDYCNWGERRADE